MKPSPIKPSPIKPNPNPSRSVPSMTVPKLVAQKNEQKIVMLTAYDKTMASLLDDQADVLLVGDSLGCVVQGQATTLGVTLEQMIYHAAMVKQGASKALVVADLPFGSYQKDAADAVDASIRMIKESGVSAVKFEGGLGVCESISRVTAAGIPVMAHIGLTPQSFHAMGGNKVQGREAEAAEKLMKDALGVEAAGAFAVVLEGIPAVLAAEITAALSIPTIGIGAGPKCDGQVLVINDLIGLNESAAPMKFNKEYCAVRTHIQAAVSQFAMEVRDREFPGPEQSY